MYFPYNLPFKRINCVEDRLLASGQHAKALIEKRRKQIEQNSKIGKISKKSKDDSDVVERLYKYKKEHEEKLQELKKKKDENVKIFRIDFYRSNAHFSHRLIKN